MNAGFDHHFSYQVLEDYAMEVLSGRDSAPVEEHILICSACQDLLAEADEYIKIARAALTLSAHGDNQGQPLVTEFRARRRLSKAAAAAATLTGASLLN
jgi:predicted anti-sigma-YlaC factor YlaD